MAVVGSIVFASFQRSAQSQSTSPAFTAGPSLPSHRVATGDQRKGAKGAMTNIKTLFGLLVAAVVGVVAFGAAQASASSAADRDPVREDVRRNRSLRG